MTSLYEIEKILSLAYVGPVLYYKIKWKGYPENEATWEHPKHLKNIKRHENQLGLNKFPLRFNNLQDLYENEDKIFHAYKQLQQQNEVHENIQDLILDQGNQQNDCQESNQIKKLKDVDSGQIQLKCQEKDYTEQVLEGEKKEEFRIVVKQEDQERNGKESYQNDEIVQVLDVFNVYVRKTKELEVIAKVRKYKKAEKQLKEEYVMADDLKNNSKTLKLILEYFLTNIEMKVNPVIVDKEY